LRPNFFPSKKNEKNAPKLYFFESELGSMLWSQFSAIFASFLRKNGVFLKNQCYDQILGKTRSSLRKKRQIFLKS
jgi:hypothetical protein